MDLLGKRYADPSFLLDGYIRTGRLCDFVPSVIKAKNEDEQWQFYLHKVFDKTYSDFKQEIEDMSNVQNMSESSMEATIKNSFTILGNFDPTKEGDE